MSKLAIQRREGEGGGSLGVALCKRQATRTWTDPEGGGGGMCHRSAAEDGEGGFWMIG